MKHMARYFIPGIMFAETDTRELTQGVISEAKEKAPEYAYCFVLYDLADDNVQAPPGYEINPVEQNTSKRHYLGGQVYTLAELDEQFPEDEYRILRSNARGNGYGRLIHCSTGNWQPFEDGDVVV